MRYLADTTSPEIGWVVRKLARALSKPCTRHVRALKHMLRYLLGARERGLCFLHKSQTEHHADLEDAIDSDFAGDLPTRRSTTGLAVLYKGSLVHYASSCNRLSRNLKVRQSILQWPAWPLQYTLRAACDVKWLSQICAQWLLTDESTPVPLECDNAGAIYMANAAGPTKRSNYIDVHHLSSMKQPGAESSPFAKSRSQCKSRYFY